MGESQNFGISHFWMKSKANRVKNICKQFSKTRFQQILHFLHFADNDEALDRLDPNYDPLWKMRKFLDHLSTKFEEEAVFTQNLSLDEMIIPFKGRLFYRVYMKDKPHKWGVKVYALCTKDGYLARFEVYGSKKSSSILLVLKILASQVWLLFD